MQIELSSGSESWSLPPNHPGQSVSAQPSQLVTSATELPSELPSDSAAIAMPTILLPIGDLVGAESIAFLTTLAAAIASSREIVIDFLWVEQGDQALIDGLFKSLQTAKASGTALSWISMNATLSSRWQVLWAAQPVHSTFAPMDCWLPRFEQFLDRHAQGEQSQFSQV